MTKQNLITHQISGVSVLQRESDGFFNATVMCKVASKRINNYLRNDITTEYLEALSADMGIPITALVQAVRGGNVQTNQGTWVHPKVAIHLAQWLSPDFAVQVTNLVMDWMNGGAPPPPQIPTQQKSLPNGHEHYTLHKWQGSELISTQVVTFPVLQKLIDSDYPSSALLSRADLLNTQEQVRHLAHQAAASISKVLQPLEISMLGSSKIAMDRAMASFPR